MSASKPQPTQTTSKPRPYAPRYWVFALLLVLLLGPIGVDRLYTGHKRLAAAKAALFFGPLVLTTLQLASLGQQHPEALPQSMQFPTDALLSLPLAISAALYETAGALFQLDPRPVMGAFFAFFADDAERSVILHELPFVAVVWFQRAGTLGIALLALVQVAETIGVLLGLRKDARRAEPRFLAGSAGWARAMGAAMLLGLSAFVAPVTDPVGMVPRLAFKVSLPRTVFTVFPTLATASSLCSDCAESARSRNVNLQAFLGMEKPSRYVAPRVVSTNTTTVTVNGVVVSSTTERSVDPGKPFVPSARDECSFISARFAILGSLAAAALVVGIVLAVRTRRAPSALAFELEDSGTQGSSRAGTPSAPVPPAPPAPVTPAPLPTSHVPPAPVTPAPLPVSCAPPEATAPVTPAPLPVSYAPPEATAPVTPAPLPVSYAPPASPVPAMPGSMPVAAAANPVPVTPTAPSSGRLPLVAAGLGAVAVAGALVVVLRPKGDGPSTPQVADPSAATASAVTAAAPSAVPASAPSSLATAVPAAAPPPSASALVTAPAGDCPSGMVAVPAGSFDRSDPQNPARRGRIDVAAFCLDRTEVTVAAYAACVAKGACTAADSDKNCNSGATGRADHPVNCVDWFQAKAFCEARAARLPTEEEWEFAARGSDARLYPWGSDAPSNQACWSGATSDVGRGRRTSTCPVGAYPAGNSPLGVADLAGNVWEWMGSEDRSNVRMFRGGGWNGISPDSIRTDLRSKQGTGVRLDYLGFRCAGPLSR